MKISGKPAGGGRVFAFAAGVIYILSVLSIVVGSRILGIHDFDMRLTVSRYIGLDVRSSVLYFAAAVPMCLFMVLHIRRSGAGPVRKAVYYLIAAEVSGCALFPCAPSRSVLSETVHNYFAYGLILTVTLSLLLTTVCGRGKKSRVFAAAGLLYAAAFVFCYVSGAGPFMNLLFVWENIFILVLLTEILLEE